MWTTALQTHRHSIFYFFQAVAESGNLERLHELIPQVSFIDCTDSAGRSALHVAAGSGQVAAASLLIGAGASVNGPVGRAGPLHAAAVAGDTAMIKLLVAAGADVSHCDAQGVSPLQLVRQGGMAQCAAAMVKEQ